MEQELTFDHVRFSTGAKFARRRAWVPDHYIATEVLTDGDFAEVQTYSYGVNTGRSALAIIGADRTDWEPYIRMQWYSDWQYDEWLAKVK